MRRMTRTGAAIFGAAALLALGGAAVASASPTHPSAVQTDTAPTTTTLPLFGAPLTIDVTTGPGNALTSVTVDPATNTTATVVRPHKVKFVIDNGTNTAQVQVSSKFGGQAVSAKAGTLADISGPGSWSGDPFNTGTKVTVNFTIGAAADGSPDITGVTSSDPTAVISPTDHKSSDEGDGAGARASVKFISGTQARILIIAVRISTGDGEDDPQAKLMVALTPAIGQKLPAVQVVGPQTWNGTLCDGSKASITFTVNADGSVSNVTPTPAADVKTGDDNGDNGNSHGHSVLVSFSDHEKVGIHVRSNDDGSQMALQFKERIRCDSSAPTVNVPTSTTTKSGDGEGDHNGGGFPGWPGGGGDGGKRHPGGDDGSTTTTSTTATTTATTVANG